MPGLFTSNPLALSVPDAVFETWLRDTGYLEVLDSRPITAAAAASSSSSVASAPTASVASVAASSGGALRTLLTILTSNPFAKLAPSDFSSPTPPWTLSFIAAAGSYSWPPAPAQARMRLQENVRRYARNYAVLAVLLFACCLYQMPLAAVGAVAALAVWEGVRFCARAWELEEKHPVLREVLVRIAQIASAVILFLCNLQMALICAVSISYAVMILHASLRKLTPSKQNQDRRFLQRKVQFPVK